MKKAHSHVSIIVAVLMLVLVFSASAEENTSPLSLEQAVAIALRDGTAMEKATLELQEEEISYREGRANLLLSPSILQELSLETSWRVAQRNFEMARADQAMEVEEAYYNVLRSERALQISEENLERARKQLDEMRTRLDLGMVAEIDVQSAELEEARAQSERIRAESALELARRSLNLLLGRRADMPLLLSTELETGQPDITIDESIDHALVNRLEIKIAEDTVVLREKDVEVKSTDFTPPLEREKARVGLANARIDLTDLKERIEIEIRRNYQNLNEAKRQIPLQEGNLHVTRERLRIDQARFDAGVITSLDLMDSQNRAYEAETAFLQAQFDYNVALATFFKSLGMSLEERTRVFSSPPPPAEVEEIDDAGEPLPEEE